MAERAPGREPPSRSRALHRWTAPGGETRDLALHIRLLGSGAPSILLLHGLAASNRYFGGAFDVLARENALLAPDLLGFGSSPRPTDVDYGPQVHAEALIETLEQLRPPPPLYVAAHSTGLLVALALTARRPAWIAGLLAFGPPLYRDPEQAHAHLVRLGLWTRWFALDTVWARWSCGWMCRHRATAARLAQWMRPDLPPPIARDGVRHCWESYSGTLRRLILAAQPPQDLSALSCPIRWIAGDRDPVVDADYLRELCASHPHVQFEIWPGGHDLPLTAPERCVGAIRELLHSRAVC